MRGQSKFFFLFFVTFFFTNSLVFSMDPEDSENIFRKNTIQVFPSDYILPDNSTAKNAQIKIERPESSFHFTFPGVPEKDSNNPSPATLPNIRDFETINLLDHKKRENFPHFPTSHIEKTPDRKKKCMKIFAFIKEELGSKTEINMISQELKAKIANKFNLSTKAVDDQIYRLQKKGALQKKVN